MTKIIKDFELKFEGIKLKFIQSSEEIPSRDGISAVFLIGFIDGLLVAARNERGWDIPGGHVEPNDQDLFNSLQRESEEEAGVIVNSAQAFALMQLDGRDDSMLFYVSSDCQFGNFIPSEDALERELMSIDKFIPLYNWKKEVMKFILDKALLALK